MIFSQEQKKEFKNYIARRGGLYFKDHDLKNIEDVVIDRVKALGNTSVSDYYHYLTMSEKKEDELRELLNLLTINHTYFFRNEPHFKALKENVLPGIIKRCLSSVNCETLDLLKGANDKTRPTIRIWSAGCSTGQEPYSVAILLKELIDDMSQWDVHILATDVSEQALSVARTGIYNDSSMRHVPEEYVEKYFDKIEPSFEQNNPNISQTSVKYEIRSEIKDMVTFAYFNLMEESFPSGFDIILCRNVVIYFDFETTFKVMDKMYSSLLGNGYLFIGYSESLQLMYGRFKMVCLDDAICYSKLRVREVPAQEKLAVSNDALDKALEEMSRKQAIAELEAEFKDRPEDADRIESILAEAIKFSHLKDYEKALELTDAAIKINSKVIDPYCFAAEILLNQGRTEDAKERLKDALSINSLFAPAYYLLGCAYMEENNMDRAQESLKKAMFIEKDFLLAHFYMANLYRDQRSVEHAIREYRNTLKTLSGRSPGDIIAYSGGFSAVTLTSVCKDNIERLKEVA